MIDKISAIFLYAYETQLYQISLDRRILLSRGLSSVANADRNAICRAAVAGDRSDGIANYFLV